MLAFDKVVQGATGAFVLRRMLNSGAIRSPFDYAQDGLMAPRSQRNDALLADMTLAVIAPHACWIDYESIVR